MAETFHQRLVMVRKTGDLTTADLAHWFERPFPTVRLWLEKDISPRTGPAGKLTMKRLKLLEYAIDFREGMPPPASLSAMLRPEYIKRVRDELERRSVPARGATG